MLALPMVGADVERRREGRRERAGDRDQAAQRAEQHRRIANQAVELAGPAETDRGQAAEPEHGTHDRDNARDQSACAASRGLDRDRQVHDAPPRVVSAHTVRTWSQRLPGSKGLTITSAIPMSR